MCVGQCNQATGNQTMTVLSTRKASTTRKQDRVSKYIRSIVLTKLSTNIKFSVLSAISVNIIPNITQMKQDAESHYVPNK